MVKGISRQVIVVQSPDRKLFEQAIFILKDEAIAQGVTDELLLKEAEKSIRQATDRPGPSVKGAVWAAAGAAVTGLAWLITTLF